MIVATLGSNEDSNGSSRIWLPIVATRSIDGDNNGITVWGHPAALTELPARLWHCAYWTCSKSDSIFTSVLNEVGVDIRTVDLGANETPAEGSAADVREFHAIVPLFLTTNTICTSM